MTSENDIISKDRILASQASAALNGRVLEHYNAFITHLNNELEEKITAFPAGYAYTIYTRSEAAYQIAWTRFLDKVRTRFVIASEGISSVAGDYAGGIDTCFSFTIIRLL